jgi:mono/diheme cytochrome c family protein
MTQSKTISTRIAVAAFSLVFVGLTGTARAQDAKVTRGQKLYADNRCQMCHSIDGKGNAKGPLDDVGTRLTAEQLRQWLINPAEMTGKMKATRKPPMPPYAKLPKEDVEALVAYMQTMKKK